MARRLQLNLATKNCTITKKTGIKKIPIEVAANILETTAVSILLRAAEPAPLAIAKGKQPIMKANEVMIIGRKMSRKSL